MTLGAILFINDPAGKPVKGDGIHWDAFQEGITMPALGPCRN
jgi:hypothetical protein